MKKTPTLECFFDGACYPKNPYGTMGMGACINEMGIELWKCSHTIPAGKANSNNVAEYLALEYILDELMKQAVKMETIVIKGDSKLVIEQMSGKYKIKSGMYVPVAIRCKKKVMHLSSLNDIKFQWIPREQNSYCDSLSGGDNFNKPNNKVLRGSFEVVDGKLSFNCTTTNIPFNEVLFGLTKLRDELNRQIDNQQNCPYHGK